MTLIEVWKVWKIAIVWLNGLAIGLNIVWLNGLVIGLNIATFYIHRQLASGKRTVRPLARRQEPG